MSSRKTKLLIVHHRHQFYREYLENKTDAFEITGVDYRDPLPFESHDAEIMLCWHLPEGIVARMPNLKWIAACSAGVDHILRETGDRRDIPVTRSKGTMGQFMAEYVLQHTLNHIRNYQRNIEQEKEHKWRFIKSDLLQRKTLGILGFGSIGQHIGKVLQKLDIRVLASKRSPLGELDENNCDQLFLEGSWREMIPQLDVLVVLMPNTPENRGFVNYDLIKGMKETALLINIARGPVVDQAGLLKALDEGVIAGAVLDVFDQEPLDPEHVFWNHPKVVVTPHCSGPSEEFAISEEFLENYKRWLKGKTLFRLVDFEKGY